MTIRNENISEQKTLSAQSRNMCMNSIEWNKYKLCYETLQFFN